MNFDFRNKNVNLAKLSSLKIQEIISNSIKENQIKLKKQLNDKQTEYIMNELMNVCQNDVNEKIYESTIKLLMEQYEDICKPMIYNELKEQIDQSCRSKF